MLKTGQQLLEELNTLDENTSIEAKTASDVGKSLLETVCAFANEPLLGGGYILLGVAPVSNSFWPMYEPVDIPNPDQLQKNIATQCATAFNAPIRPQISTEKIGDKTVVVMFVAEANAHEKPVHFKNQPLPKSAFRRIGSTDQHCTEDDLIVFYENRRGETYDEQVIHDATIHDFDEEAIELYRQLRGEVDAQADELTWNDMELLEAVGALKRKGEQFVPTVAGVLLFGKPIALRRHFPMMRIDYIRVPALSWVKDPDRRFDTVEIRAPLIRAIQRARSAILDDLPKAFSLPAGELQGKDIPLLPDRVVREVVANAVMHRDYRVHGSIQIIRYANRLEIRNPGYSLKASERLGEPGSETRNPRIAAVLHDVKFAETKGSGIRVMRELMADCNLSLPLLESDRANNSFMAMLLFHHFLSEDDLNWLKSFEEFTLTEDEMKAMISAREVGAVNNSSYRDINRQADTLAASKHLRKLCDCELLEKKGQGSATYYVPTRRALSNWPPPPVEGGAVRSETKPRDLEGKPRELETIPRELEAKPRELDSKQREVDDKPSDLNPDSADPSELNAKGETTDIPIMPDALKKKLSQLGGKGKREDLLSTIVSLLKWRKMTLAELAAYMNRNAEYIRNTYLVELIRAEIVEPTIRDKPNDPKQSYRAVRMEDYDTEAD